MKHTWIALSALGFSLAACSGSNFDSTGSSKLRIEIACSASGDCPAQFECEVENEHGVSTTFCESREPASTDDGKTGATCPAGFELEDEHGTLFCKPHGGNSGSGGKGHDDGSGGKTGSDDSSGGKLGSDDSSGGKTAGSDDSGKGGSASDDSSGGKTAGSDDSGKGGSASNDGSAKDSDSSGHGSDDGSAGAGGNSGSNSDDGKGKDDSHDEKKG